MRNEKKLPRGYRRRRVREILGILSKYNIREGITPEKFRAIVEELGPVFVKVGQILSMRQDVLPEAYCQELAKLRTDVAPLPFKTIADVLESAYHQPLRRIFARIDHEPLGSASIAQVHRAVLLDGTPVVVKVQRPGVQETMKIDLSILNQLTTLLQRTGVTGDVIDFKMVLSEVAATARQEMDFMNEGHNAEIFAHNNSDIRYVDCPTIFKHYTTSNVLMMSYMGGIDIDETDRLVEEGYDLQEIAVKLVDNYIKQIVDDAFFQADPHPGNIRIHDGKIGWIDLGMMGTLSRRDCELFREAISAVAAKNISAIKTVVLSLGDHTGKIDHTRLYADLSDLMDEYGSVNIGEMSLSEFLQDLLHICNVNHIQMPQGVTMLVRGVMTIESVVAKLDPSASIVSVMQQHILEPSLQDLDLRVTAKKLTRSLISAGTHTLDLPENLNNLSKEALKGHSKFNLEIVGSEEPIKQLGKMVNRLVLAVITAALLLASSFLAITDMKPQILGIPALAFFGYLGALILGGGTLYSVYRSWRKKKKRRPFFFPK